MKRAVAAGILALTLPLVGGVAGQAPADGAGAPYGGCKEASAYPWTPGWRWCVRNDRLDIAFRPCRHEDGPAPCVWDARHRGNGEGQSFVIGKHRVRHVGHDFAHTVARNWRER